MSFLEYKIKYVLLVILDNSLAVKKSEVLTSQEPTPGK